MFKTQVLRYRKGGMRAEKNYLRVKLLISLILQVQRKQETLAEKTFFCLCEKRMRHEWMAEESKRD